MTWQTQDIAASTNTNCQRRRRRVRGGQPPNSRLLSDSLRLTQALTVEHPIVAMHPHHLHSSLNRTTVLYCISRVTLQPPSDAPADHLIGCFPHSESSRPNTAPQNQSQPSAHHPRHIPHPSASTSTNTLYSSSLPYSNATCHWTVTRCTLFLPSHRWSPFYPSHPCKPPCEYPCLHRCDEPPKIAANMLIETESILTPFPALTAWKLRNPLLIAAQGEHLKFP